ncbi:MAG: tetratricopeptide repeat protein, partial [Candidatus Latescibacterota bacterium]
MKTLPPLAFKKNLERVTSETTAGDWRIGVYVDLVSERKYTLFRLKQDRSAQIRPDVLSFRAETAAALAPKGCAPIVDALWSNDRLDVLCPFLDAVDPAAIDDADAEAMLEALLRTLDTFERHRFDAPDLGIDSVGRDEDGTFVLMPNAYISPSPPSVAGRYRTSESPHAAALEEMLNALASGDAGPAGSIRSRAAAAAAAMAARRLRSLTDLHERLFGTPLCTERRRPAPDGDNDTPIDVESLASGLAQGTIVELHGGPAAGKSRVLCELFARLEANGGSGVHWIDEWDLAAATKKRSPVRGRDASVWLIDDIEEKRVVHADLVDRLFHDGGTHPGQGPALVYTVNRSTAPQRLLSELDAAGSRAGDRYRKLDVAGRGAAAGASRLKEDLGALLETLGAGGVGDGHSDGEYVAAVTGALDPQERQILELVSVAGFPLPHDVALAVFSDSDGGLHRRIHRLAGLGLLRIDYRPLPPAGLTSITLAMRSASMRRLIYEGISPERRENLHRTVARMGEDRGGMPPAFLFEHLVAGNERSQAAKYGVALLKETSRDRHAPLVARLIAEFIDNGLVEELSFTNRLFVMHELSAELLAGARRSEAENLLIKTKKEVDAADSEERRKNATLVCDTFGLLADAWAARGNYSRALTLLSDTKESLNPYLTLPAQARLLNEIGWLLYRLGDYERAVESCKLSLNSLNANEYPIIVAQALNIMGVIKFNTSRYDEAITYYDQSAFLREREGDVNALSASYNNLGLAYQTKGEYDKALDYYKKSLEIKKMQNNRGGIAAGCLNLALLYLEVRNFEEAEKNCRESLAICEQLGNTRLTAENYCTLGDVAYTRGQFDEAEKYYQKSLGLSHSLETINEEMGAQRRLAQLYLATERFAEARNTVEKAAKLGRQIGSRYENAQIESILGDLDNMEGREQEAIQHYESAAASYSAASRFRLAAPMLARIGLIHFEQGSIFEAKHYLDRSLELTRSEIGTEIPDEIVNLQKLLRERPIKEGTTETGPQKLLYAFYELSSLSDYADDSVAFYKRVLNVFQDLTGSTQCFLTILGDDGQHAKIDGSGAQEPLVDLDLRALCTRALQRGGPIDSSSQEATDLRDKIQLPPGNAFVCVPMRTMGRNLGCVVCYVPEGAVPLSKDDSDFLTSLGRHVAGDVRLMLHLEEHEHKEKTLEKKYESLQMQVVDQYRFENLIGKDESMKKIFRTLEKVKDMDTGLLILGESGTGKTELARTIHYSSPRRKRPFQQLHCAEIPPTLLESELFGHEKGAFTGAAQRKLGRCEVADGGTVFL